MKLADDVDIFSHAVRGRPSLSDENVTTEGANRSVQVSQIADVVGSEPFLVQCGVSVMMAKPFVMMVVATLIGPAIGVGLFILVSNF